MLEIQLENNLPNQKFTFKTADKTLELELRTTSDNITLLSVSYNGNYIARSIKVAPNCLILCYDYLQQEYGDFIFTTDDGEYPYYENFNGSNKLYWLNYDEVKEYKNRK